MFARSRSLILATLLLLTALAALTLHFRTRGISHLTSVARSERHLTPSTRLSPVDLALIAPAGSDKIDDDIRALQQQIKDSPAPGALFVRLGWAFVTKARLTSDPGFYKIAEQCAAADDPADPEGALLRGHIQHALHRFHDAEATARKLVAQREFVFDYALLGDALMEQGKLDEAVRAYQKMVDLKPCLQTYSRVAHMRWLKGDVAGAIAASRLAVSSGSPREPEPLAWAATRLAFYQLQQNAFAAALASTEEAAHYAPNYAPALLLRGRVLLAQGNGAEAIQALKQASALSPLPEYFWTLADALRADGKAAEADRVEAKLISTGAASDPRTLSLFLASRRADSSMALRLARAELNEREDVFTHDAVAWAEFANGNLREAAAEAKLALREGTQDPRLLYHAGMIAIDNGGPVDEALTLLHRAAEHAQALLPSERTNLSARLASIDGAPAHISSR